MEERRLGFMTRLWMAIWVPFKILFDGAAAARIEHILAAPSLPEGREAPPPAEKEAAPSKEPAPAKAAEPAPAPKEPDAAQALHLLAILQRDGRFVDFLQEDVAAATDDQVGAAARLVHEGCRKAVAQYFTLEPLRSESEGERIQVPDGFDPGVLRLTGNVAGKPPFQGTLVHPGWRAVAVRLPEPPAGQDVHVVAPAEVEL